MSEESAVKKEIAPLDRLQHIFNDVMQDLEQTIKRTWAYQDLEERLPLQEALDAKIETYKELFGQAIEAAATDSIKTIIQNMEEKPPALEPCEYCDGKGGTPSPFHEAGEFTIPCIACDGSGMVEK